jgi:hypothetical protein
MFLKPVPVLFGIGCINDDKKTILLMGVMIYENVIQDSAILAAEESITNEAFFDFCQIIGQTMLEKSFGLGSLDFEASHVAEVEETHFCTDLAGFFEDGAILEGHVPAAKRNEPGSSFLVDLS